MKSLVLISEDPGLEEVVAEFSSLFNWHCRLVSEKVAKEYLFFEMDLVVIGVLQGKLDLISLLKAIRKENHYHPIVIWDVGLNELDRQTYEEEYQPVFLVEAPFAVKDFLKALKGAIDFTEDLNFPPRKLDKIDRLLEAKEGNFALQLAEELEGMVSPYLYNITLAKCYLVLGNEEEALELVEEACQAAPRSPLVWLALARVKRQMEAQNEGKDILREHYELIEDLDHGLLLFADLCLETGDVEGAKKHYSMAYELNEESQVAKNSLFLVALLEGRVKGLRIPKSSYVSSVSLVLLCHSKARVLAHAEQFALVEELYKNAIAVLPDQRLAHRLWFNLGIAMTRWRDYDKAKGYFESGLQVAPAEAGERFKQQLAYVSQKSSGP